MRFFVRGLLATSLLGFALLSVAPAFADTSVPRAAAPLDPPQPVPWR